MIVPSLKRGTLSLAAVSLLASSAAAEVFERLASVPTGWHHSRAPKGSQPINLQIALAQGDVAGFEKSLLEMSSPDHPNYGQHYRTHEEMKRMLQPSASSVDAVSKWLRDAGVTDFQQSDDWISIHTTVASANDLLEANFQYYVNDAQHVERLRTLEYSIPDSLVAHINLVTPTTRFGQLHADGTTIRDKKTDVNNRFRQALGVVGSTSTDCNQAITPQCLKDLYSIGDYEANPDNGNSVAFSSFLEQYAQYADLALFEKNIAKHAAGHNFTVQTVAGGKNIQGGSGDSSEANLDAQQSSIAPAAVAPLVPDLDQPDPNNDNNEPYLDLLQYLVKLDDSELPKVLSTSYGEDEQSVPEKYARSVCNLYSQLGSRGVSVIFSSGDSGVGAACETNDGKNTTHFPPQFPAACPWVTSVGATTEISPERASTFSSGGFSDLWDRPDYQNEAVSAYLTKLGDQWAGLFNPKGRAFPDVAAQGQNYAIYEKGRLGSVDGTSCSAPTFAGVIALLNDARIEAKQAPLGFLNPWLYSSADALNDVTVGGSTGCDGNSRFGGAPNGGPVVPYASWNATEGWDPVTGLGTPNFAKLRKAAKV
ncbi:hypothetical protein N7468_008842 [Penicillium chermesinum]|uniref:tripeptidyl-peptidase II n=1 Tax=Penicillium chermesinum TaxID=63820 RepID=A0A9W9NJA0_9EURO|nr:uncharacterized protein N7468_008842 [Penicillium chermesinum]KAJ5219638.1 hypothetical protein N7468_008842 [Penicillium chermesinum]